MEFFRRAAPKPVEPIVVGNVRYQVMFGTRKRFNQSGGIVGAFNVTTGEELWAIAVYKTAYDEKEEIDAQDIFITTMAITPDGTHLTITDTGKRTFLVNLIDQAVIQQ